MALTVGGTSGRTALIEARGAGRTFFDSRAPGSPFRSPRTAWRAW